MAELRPGRVAPRLRLVLAVVAAGAAAASVEARVTRIVIDSATPVAGGAIAYETLRGRAFGELDPNDAKNAVITDIQLARDVDGKVRYETSFTVTKPVDPSKTSGFMWHDLPNRGGGSVIVQAERDLGDVGLTSGWQADNAGASAVPANHATGSNHWVQVPMARVNGQPVTGTVLARNLNRSGADSQPLNVMGNPVPYLPASLSTADVAPTTSTKETVNGQITVGGSVAKKAGAGDLS